MEDRFKFRAWYKNNYIYDVEEATDNSEYLTGDKMDDFSSFADVVNREDCVVEQCTGLKDKNEKLIYEGDIVKIIDKSSRKEPFIGVVEYTNTASFEANCNGFYMYLHNPKTPENVSMIEKMFCTSLREIEVIGNIHEKPELLGEDR